jgi:hypothetical protein
MEAADGVAAQGSEGEGVGGVGEGDLEDRPAHPVDRLDGPDAAVDGDTRADGHVGGPG